MSIYDYALRINSAIFWWVPRENTIFWLTFIVKSLFAIFIAEYIKAQRDTIEKSAQITNIDDINAVENRRQKYFG